MSDARGNGRVRQDKKEEQGMDDFNKEVQETLKQVAILFGGCSPEFSVSLQSAYSVITHIDRKKYTPVLIGISNAGDWFKYDGEIEKILADTWCNEKDCTPVVVSPNRTVQRLLTIKKGKVNEIHIDAAFPVLQNRQEQLRMKY